MERNIILFQPWPLVKFQVLNVFNYLKLEDKITLTGGLIKVSILHLKKVKKKAAPPVNEMIETHSEVTQEKGFTAKAVLAQMC